MSRAEGPVQPRNQALGRGFPEAALPLFTALGRERHTLPIVSEGGGSPERHPFPRLAVFAEGVRDGPGSGHFQEKT